MALHNQEIQTAYLNKIALRDKLRHAIKHDLLNVYYQPIVDQSTGCIVKFEALVRWFDDEQGMISPGAFIPIAEEFGLIQQIGHFVLKKACRDLSKMHSLGYADVSISVNRSVNEFKVSNNQFDLVTEAIESANIPFGSLTVEVTESMATNHYTWQLLRDLREKGVKIALDDFCTGYSSLSHLIENQVDYLKIDKSFVDSLLQDKSKQIMISCLVDMAKQLGIKVIAEGVESENQLTVLKELGCDHIQGYYYSPARPIGACIHLLEEFNGEKPIELNVLSVTSSRV
ncbi:putative bifunctional diguanylate cyclase/phosphodiesterase [Pseudoalteromonas luteoviolacea]|uniref:putative bifunctional diguanylate cyclase/phosphodiesterase n=1 Tax=Pseudoalteromonas luteoviolacea TaxID=43657 RepID=UPI000AB75FCB|nr:EAL domain-containing protein [Pseudoalteromonas luteoviolacea]